MGLCVDLDGNNGYVHISRVEDEKVNHLTKKNYRAGKSIKSRIIAFNYVEGYACLSTEPSVVSAPFLRMEDVTVGSTIKGSVISANEKGVLVKITENIHGYIPKPYLADVILSNPAKRFPVNSTVNCKVFNCNVENRRILLTSKKTLLKTKYPLITQLEDGVRGTISHGVVTKVSKAGCVVTFYNNIQGFLGNSDVVSNGVDPTELFVGK
eukprot:Pgem_evm1s554